MFLPGKGKNQQNIYELPNHAALNRRQTDKTQSPTWTGSGPCGLEAQAAQWTTGVGTQRDYMTRPSGRGDGGF
jgi:hypothetical protein